MSRLISLTHSVEFLVALLTSAIGCSSGGNSSNKTFCSPGDTQLCVGANGCKGGQQCTKDGSGWSVCDCGSTVTSAGSSSIAGGSAVGGGSSTGGGSSSGSVPIAGNEQTSGGTKANGGASSTGGLLSTGGNYATGGTASRPGGAANTGAAVATGGGNIPAGTGGGIASAAAGGASSVLLACTASPTGGAAGAANSAGNELSTCANRITDGAETDVDCGGPLCPPCELGNKCAANADCNNGLCIGNVCYSANCNNGIKDANEADVDCGGNCYEKCYFRNFCATDSDCLSNFCWSSGSPSTTAMCYGDGCANGLLDGGETDVNCGGDGCPPCPDGKACSSSSDCASNLCSGAICGDGDCSNSVKDGSETDVDCGGEFCPKCTAGKACQSLGDCQTRVCSSGLCSSPTCSDGMKNGAETDTDCGGPNCPGCLKDQNCVGNTDCAMLNCPYGQCFVPTCSDYIKNAAESDVDCGSAACPGCADGKFCTTPQDCQSRMCNGSPLRCQAPSCSDGVRNGDETDVDCGGNCQPCADGLGCIVVTDCLNGTCTNGTCGTNLDAGSSSGAIGVCYKTEDCDALYGATLGVGLICGAYQPHVCGQCQNDAQCITAGYVNNTICDSFHHCIPPLNTNDCLAYDPCPEFGLICDQIIPGEMSACRYCQSDSECRSNPKFGPISRCSTGGQCVKPLTCVTSQDCDSNSVTNYSLGNWVCGAFEACVCGPCQNDDQCQAFYGSFYTCNAGECSFSGGCSYNGTSDFARVVLIEAGQDLKARREGFSAGVTTTIAGSAMPANCIIEGSSSTF